MRGLIMKEVDNNSYLIIKAWMKNDLNLSGYELNAFALIYGFSQDGKSKFEGSLNYFCYWLDCSRPTVIKTLKELISKDLIIKESIDKNGVTFNNYSANLPVVNSVNLGSKLCLPHNNTNKIVKYNIIEKKLLRILKELDLLKEEHNIKSEVSFADSIVFNQDIWKRMLDTEEKLGIDIMYYYQSVFDWNETLKAKDKKKKRTSTGWVATARTFMRNDKEKNKLKVLGTQEIGLDKDQMDYLNM